MTIGLLGQPNAGKSTLFNGLTGSRQHVGNWPGKTVEQKEGYFTHQGTEYTIVDLPGSYSLSANSDEEIVTREYIASQEADLIFVMADASQLERSLYMLADYAGINKPTVLLLNMMDVASSQGKSIDAKGISKKLGIPVIPITAADTKNYQAIFSVLEITDQEPSYLDAASLEKLFTDNIGDPYTKLTHLLPKNSIKPYSNSWLASKLLEDDEAVKKLVEKNVGQGVYEEIKEILSLVSRGSLLTSDSKFKWIEEILKDNTNGYQAKPFKMGTFDKIVTSKRWGKPIALLVIISGLFFSTLLAQPLIALGGFLQELITPIIASGLFAINAPNFIISLVCDGMLPAIAFSFEMASFVFGISLVFGFLEEIGYMARISYVFDSTMSKLGLQGKAVMPFLVSFGCNIGGIAGTRVIDTWGQRVTAMSLSWIVPCSATWGVIGLISMNFFGFLGTVIILLVLFSLSILHMFITSKVFGNRLIKKEERTGLIMELPPYHKPKYLNLFRFVLNRMGDILVRSMKVILMVSIAFWALSYSSTGSIENSVIYKVGNFVEPVTMWFGLRWQTFTAFISSLMGKEAALGVLSSVFSSGQTVAMMDAMDATFSTSALGNTLTASLSKPEALAFIFVFYFNVPCLLAMGSTLNESRSLKWTLRIAAYYVTIALLMAALSYRVGLLIF